MEYVVEVFFIHKLNPAIRMTHFHVNLTVSTTTELSRAMGLLPDT